MYKNITSNTKSLFESVILNANTSRLRESKEDLIRDFGDLCAKKLGIKKVEHYQLRNEKTTLAVYNEEDNAIYYHSDLLWLPDNLVKSVIAHEVSHAAAGYINDHNEIWRSYYNELKDDFPKDDIKIFVTVDEIVDDIEKDKDYFSDLKPGKVMQALYKEYPELEGHVKVGLRTGFGLVDVDAKDDELLIVRPTFYCSDTLDIDGKKVITDSEIKDAEYAAEDVLDALGIELKESKRLYEIDTWVDPRSKIKGWKVKVLDVEPDEFGGSTTAKVELFDPDGNSQGEDIIYVHRKDIKIGRTYDAYIDGIMASPKIKGVDDIPYSEVPDMRKVTKDRYLEDNSRTTESKKVTITFQNDSKADSFRAEMRDHFNYPTKQSKYAVVHGDDGDGGSVFVD